MDCQIRTNNSKGGDSKYRGRRKTFKTRKQKRLESQNRKDDRDTNPRKNAYADIVKKNEDFEFYYKRQNIVESESEWEEFLEILQKPLPSAFRISSFCAGQARKMRDIIEGDYIQKFFLENGTEPSQDLQIFPLPWYPNKLAWTMNLSKVEIRKSQTLNKFHQFLISETETGDISRQEAVSMIPPLLLDIKAGQTVLDLCAAPGSKTAQIIEMLHQETSSTFLTDDDNNKCITDKILDGLVVANDVDNRRCYMLVHQSKRLHSPCVVITNHDASTLPNFYTDNNTILKFDRVLADVPCSGDGTFRKNYEVWSKWNAGNSNNLHYLQSKIAKRGVELLKKDGIMAYSTCSLNPIENEAVIASLLNSAQGDLELINPTQLLPELKRRQGLETWSVMTKECKMFDSHQEVPENLRNQLRESLFPPANVSELNLKYCMRIMPHYQNTGGFFIALIRKKVDKMCWEPKDQPINDDQDQNQKPLQQQRQQNVSKKRKRFMGHREDPFFFLNETDPDWLSLKSYYRFPDNFNVNQLAHRCSKGKRRNIYYLTEKAADFIKNNEHVKLITGGARVFNRLEVKVLSCPYRITQEGIPSIFPYFVLDLDKYSPPSDDGASHKDTEPEATHLKIIEFDFEHYVRLLQQEGLKTEELSDDVKKLMEKIPTGCCIFYVRINYLNDGGNESKFILPICVWKGKNSIRAYVAKNDRIHLLRLCGHEPVMMMSAAVNGDQEETDDKRRILDDGDDDDDDDDDDQSTEKSQKRLKLGAEESNNNQTSEDQVC